MYYIETAHEIEDYEQEILDRLLRLRQENPSCWRQMRAQIIEQSDAGKLSNGSVIHWLDQCGFNADNKN